MKCIIVFISLVLGATVFLNAQSVKLDSFSDGPYIFWKEDTLKMNWITSGKLIHQDAHYEDYQELTKADSLYFPSYIFRPDKKNKITVHFQNVDRFLAISDLHGQYDLSIELLLKHGIIDENHNWIYGDGHLVMVGDIFDRGDGVTDLCWFFYELEKKAEAAGGKVHIMIGNHEMMVFNGDLRYVNRSYRYSSAFLKKTYDQIFAPNSLLGQWLRSKPIALSINDVAFVHAGFSDEVLSFNLSFKKINKLFREKIYDKPEDKIAVSPLLNTLYFNKGPLWYRGYFEPDFNEAKADEILKKLGYKHLVIGHTSMMNIKNFFGNKIFCIDSSIKTGKRGEVLIYEKGKFYQGLLNGEKKPY